MDEKARRRFEQMYQEYEGTVRRLAYGYNIPVDYDRRHRSGYICFLCPV